jgi:predicted alternative tryptophan synthase beta-subunit
LIAHWFQKPRSSSTAAFSQVVRAVVTRFFHFASFLMPTSTPSRSHTFIPNLEAVKTAELKLRGVARQTPLELNVNLSKEFGANVFLKREDLQIVRSYKIRGAYNKISSLSQPELAKGIVCASAGNHAQGVAYSCAKLQIHGTIFMPAPTPQHWSCGRCERAIVRHYPNTELPLN